MLVRPASRMRVAMASRCGALGSVGCQRMSGSCAAKKHTCWPVPDATSSTLPDAGSTDSSTVRIGSLLRSAAAEVSSSLAIAASCVAHAVGADAPYREPGEQADDAHQHCH